ncbi:hypothetical protein DPMN_070154 [Dreissena polymorpha]|uniref:Alcohol dehydrogenase-like C-terminal domain-containing protein n=1 Tax=Dreissena polymorpha TaxID=45954 RepID=A0A9D3Z2P3_DREPO|nr:hypothetical protein DPMN_070154 [Dreissena polymorpha]
MRAIRVANYGGPEFQYQYLLILSGSFGTTGRPLPYTPGSDVAGIVSKFKIGKAKGLTVIGTAGTKEGMDLVLKHGAAQAFNHKEQGYIDKVLEATNGTGPDIIIEMLANVNLDTDMKIINKGGIIVVVGSRGNVEIAPRLLMFKESIVTGFALWNAPPEEIVEMHQVISEGLTKGWLVPSVQKEYKLEEAPLAHEEIINNTGTTGNRILIM